MNLRVSSEWKHVISDFCFGSPDFTLSLHYCSDMLMTTKAFDGVMPSRFRYLVVGVWIVLWLDFHHYLSLSQGSWFCMLSIGEARGQLVLNLTCLIFKANRT